MKRVFADILRLTKGCVFLKKPFKASSLMFSVFITLLLAICTGAMFLFGFHVIQSWQRNNLILSMLWNYDNAIRYVTYGYPIKGIPKLSSLTAFSDSIYVDEYPWGALTVLQIHVSNKADTLDRFAFINHKWDDSKKLAIVLGETNRPLVVCGNTTIKGDCRLPQQGVKRGYIEGTFYKNQELFQGTEIANATSRPIPKGSNLVRVLDSLIMHLPVSYYTESLVHSFKNEILSIKPSSLASMTDITGKVLIWSDAPMTIQGHWKLQDVIVYAPEIHIGKGFTGSGQFIATDSIIVGPNVSLIYPTLLFSVRKSKINKSTIRLKSNSTVYGSIINEDLMPFTRALTEIDKSAKVYGLINTTGYVELQGTVIGEVRAKEFSLKTKSATYDNHLLNATVDRYALDDRFIPPGIGSEATKEILKWLN